MRYKVWRSNKDKELHLLCTEGVDAFELLPTAIRNLVPWTGSKEGEMHRLRLSYRSMLTEQGFTIVYAHISKLNLEAPHGPASAARASRVPRLQRQRRGGSTRWVEKEGLLAMRWAWVDQGTGRPIGGPLRARRRSASGLTRARTGPWSLLLVEQETKEDGLIRRALSSLFDPTADEVAVMHRMCAAGNTIMGAPPCLI